jgi:hypothetical protein
MTWKAPHGLRVLVRGSLAVLTLGLGVVQASGQVLPAGAPAPVASEQEMRQRYVWSTLGVRGALRATAFASYDQWQDHPAAWDRTAGGFAKRVGASYARAAIGDVTKYSVANVLHQDPSFTPCECSGFARRLWHAVEGPLTARGRDGNRMLSPAIGSGILAGHIVAAGLWEPGPFAASDVLRRTGLGLLTKVGMDVFQEFRPRRETRATVSESAPATPLRDRP